MKKSDERIGRRVQNKSKSPEEAMYEQSLKSKTRHLLEKID
jgi:hypothetical protein